MKNLDDTPLDERRRRLSKRLDSTTSSSSSTPSDTPPSDTSRGMGLASRLVSDFVVGILVGSAVGYGVDYIFGTLPFGLIFFGLLGFCASIRNILRTHSESMATNYSPKPPKKGK